MIMHRYHTEPTNHNFLHYKDHHLHLRNILCLWVTNIDITRSQEILSRRHFVYLCCVSSLRCVGSLQINNSARR